MMLLRNVSSTMNKGFSLVEALVIITIIGILATLVHSRFNYHVAKARQAEAKNTLEHLVILQESFILENRKRYSWLKSIGLKRLGGGYACGTGTPGEEMLNELGFRPKNCRSLRYEYWMPGDGGSPPKPRVPIDGANPSFMIRADSFPNNYQPPNDEHLKYIWPDCNKRDMWKVEKGNDVQQPEAQRKVLEVCK